MATRDEFNIEEDEDGNKVVVLPADQATGLREKARKADENATAATERDAAKRKLAFYESGIDMKSDLAELFVNGYDGDLDPEKIKEAAAKYPGLVTDAATTTETTTELTPEQAEAARLEAEQTAARQTLATGSAPAGEIKVDPIEASQQAAEAARKRGAPDSTAQVAALNTLVGAAVNGDQRVLIDPKTGTNMAAAS